MMRGLSGDAAWRYSKPEKKSVETEAVAADVDAPTAAGSEVQIDE